MYKETPVWKYTKLLIILMIVAVILRIVFAGNFLTNIENYTFYNGKIYLNKKDCNLANNKKCILKGFWIIKNYSLLSNKKMIFFIKKIKNNKVAIIPLIYNIDHPNESQVKAIEIYKTYKVKYNETTKKIINVNDNFDKDFIAIYGKNFYEKFIKKNKEAK